MILTSTLLPAAMALGTVLPAQETASKDAPANPALQRALDTISADEIKADLMFVASDEMAGRDSPSPQLKVAARFIRSRLMRFGFEPAAPDDSFLYEWQINSIGFDPPARTPRSSPAGGPSPSPTTRTTCSPTGGASACASCRARWSSAVTCPPPLSTTSTSRAAGS